MLIRSIFLSISLLIALAANASRWSPLCNPDDPKCPGWTPGIPALAAIGQRLLWAQQRLDNTQVLQDTYQLAVWNANSDTLDLRAGNLESAIHSCSASWPALACVSGSAAYFSQDGGTTWRRVERAFYPGSGPNHFSVPAGSIIALDDSGERYAIGLRRDFQGGTVVPPWGWLTWLRIESTQDAGVTWQSATIAPNGGLWASTVIKGDGPGELIIAAVYSGTGSRSYDGRIVRTNDLGASFQVDAIDPVLVESIPASMAADPNVPGRYWIGTSDGAVLRSDDGARTWRALGKPSSKSITAPVSFGAGLLATSDDQAVWLSVDGGYTWPSTPLHQGLFALPHVLAAIGGKLFAGSGAGVFQCPGGDCQGAAIPVPSPKSVSGLPVSFDVVEFFNTTLGHYFITADDVEAAAVDAGYAGSGWARTGNNFKAWYGAQDPRGKPVYRFYGSPVIGPNSHFYTRSFGEAEFLRVLQQSTPVNEPQLRFEAIQMWAAQSLGQSCPAGLQPIYRAYNQGFERGVDSNHRYSNSRDTIAQMVALGWRDEGLVMCLPIQ